MHDSIMGHPRLLAECRLKLPFLVMLFFFVTACAVGPDFVRPAAPEGKGYSKDRPESVAGKEAQSFKDGADIPEQWWTLFHSSELNEVIKRGLKANPNIQAADAALRVARENVYAQQGAYYPSVQASLSSSRQQTGTQMASPLASGDSLYSLHTAQLSVSYLPDLFGLNRRQVESLRAQTDFQRFQYEAAILTLTSNIVVSAVLEASLREQINSTEELVKVQSELLELTRRQFELGAVAGSAVTAQQFALAQTRANLPPIKKQLAQLRDQLSALCGGFPSDEPEEKFRFSSMTLPSELPISLPSKLVEQRPDIRAAEELLHSAGAQIGVAQANRLPQISINAGAGYSSSSLSGLFNGQNSFWSVAGGVTQPVFDGGALLHKKLAADAAYEQAGALYRATVIGAFQNVADALRAIQYDAEQAEAATEAERTAKESLAIAEKQVELGDIGYFAMLSFKQAHQQAVINLAQAKGNRLSDTAALFQALGGGWWNRDKTW